MRQQAVDVEGETLVKCETIIKFFTFVYFNLYFQIKVKHMKCTGTHHITLYEKTTEVQEIIKPDIQRSGYHFGFLVL